MARAGAPRARVRAVVGRADPDAHRRRRREIDYRIASTAARARGRGAPLAGPSRWDPRARRPRRRADARESGPGTPICAGFSRVMRAAGPRVFASNPDRPTSPAENGRERARAPLASRRSRARVRRRARRAARARAAGRDAEEAQLRAALMRCTRLSERERIEQEKKAPEGGVQKVGEMERR